MVTIFIGQEMENSNVANVPNIGLDLTPWKAFERLILGLQMEYEMLCKVDEKCNMDIELGRFDDDESSNE